MAKVNLLTMHYADNNGSFFQTYATYKLLERHGHDVKIINLQDKAWAVGRWKKLISYYKIPRYLRFESLRRRYYPFRTKKMYHVEQSKIPVSDYNIVGSDQVWNRQITNFDYLSYFLSFSKPEVKRVSLASSFGIKWLLNEEETRIIKTELERFSAISVREADGVVLCDNIFGLKATQIIDPTLAWGDFSEFLKSNKKHKDSIALFTYNSNGYTPKIADHTSEKLRMPIRWINELPRKGYKSGLLFWESPVDWINSINNSSFFITDSFHGVAFAIILNRPFVATINNIDKISRIKSLLTLFGLENRLVTSLDDFVNRFDELIKPIDWATVNTKLTEEQIKYNRFILDNIK